MSDRTESGERAGLVPEASRWRRALVVLIAGAVMLVLGLVVRATATIWLLVAVAGDAVVVGVLLWAYTRGKF